MEALLTGLLLMFLSGRGLDPPLIAPFEGLVAGLVAGWEGLVAGLVEGCVGRVEGLVDGRVVGLVVGLVAGRVVGLVAGLVLGRGAGLAILIGRRWPNLWAPEISGAPVKTILNNKIYNLGIYAWIFITVNLEIFTF